MMEVEVSVLDRYVFLFSFNREADVRRAWDRRPWSIKGRTLDVDLVGSRGGVWKNFVRVRVEMDVSCPLCTGFPLDKDDQGLPVL
nr:hypothetical protein CFP56_18773 [Quercus suber]